MIAIVYILLASSQHILLAVSFSIRNDKIHNDNDNPKVSLENSISIIRSVNVEFLFVEHVTNSTQLYLKHSHIHTCQPIHYNMLREELQILIYFSHNFNFFVLNHFQFFLSCGCGLFYSNKYVLSVSNECVRVDPLSSLSHSSPIYYVGIQLLFKELRKLHKFRWSEVEQK